MLNGVRTRGIHFFSILAIGSVLSLSACGGGDSSSSSADASNTSPPSTAPSTSPGSSGDSSNGSGKNTPPSISGSAPTTVAAGSPYNFQPSVTDPDKDALTFSISSKPRWASFDSRTGRLYGTPTSSDVGTHEEIVISVSDGKATASLPEFAINVVKGEVATASVTLDWDPPTQNTDGSALTNLKGYVIHYGKESGKYTNRIEVNSPGLTTYVVENLEPGTYYFAVTAVSANGAESNYSPEASKTI